MKLLHITALITLATMYHPSWTMDNAPTGPDTQEFITKSQALLKDHSATLTTEEMLAMGRGLEKVLKEKRDSAENNNNTKEQLNYMVELQKVRINIHLLMFATREASKL